MCNFTGGCFSEIAYNCVSSSQQHIMSAFCARLWWRPASTACHKAQDVFNLAASLESAYAHGEWPVAAVKLGTGPAIGHPGCHDQVTICEEEAGSRHTGDELCGKHRRNRHLSVLKHPWRSFSVGLQHWKSIHHGRLP